MCEFGLCMWGEGVDKSYVELCGFLGWVGGWG